MGKIILFKRGDSMEEKEYKYRLLKYILYFTNDADSVYKTKLNKLLFYMQFLYYKKYDFKLINKEFICDYYGPNMEGLDNSLKEFKEKGWIEINTTQFGKIINPKVKLNSNEYTSEENILLKQISNKFKSYTSKQISEYSHDEPIWKEGTIKKIIPIEKAKELNEF